MKTMLSLALMVVAVVSNLNAAELKVAVLDLDRVVNAYFKTAEARKEMESRKTALEKELLGFRVEVEKMEKEADSLRTSALDNALSAAAREQNKKSFEAKIEEIRRQAIKFEDFQNDGVRELRDTNQRLQYRIVEDVNKATAELGQKEGYHLILNANKTNPAASGVLFARNVDDVTDKVLTNLNAGKPKATETGSPKDKKP